MLQNLLVWKIFKTTIMYTKELRNIQKWIGECGGGNGGVCINVTEAHRDAGRSE